MIECDHDWRFLRREEEINDIFYCTHCLDEAIVWFNESSGKRLVEITEVDEYG